MKSIVLKKGIAVIISLVLATMLLGCGKSNAGNLIAGSSGDEKGLVDSIEEKPAASEEEGDSSDSERPEEEVREEEKPAQTVPPKPRPSETTEDGSRETAFYLSSDKTEIAPGDTFTVTVTVTSKRVDLYWLSLTCLVGPLSGDGKTFCPEICKYLSVTEQSFNLGDVDFMNTTTDKFAIDDKIEKGLYLSLAISTSGNFYKASEALVFTVTLRVSEDLPESITEFKLGINPVWYNYVEYTDATFAERIYDRANTKTFSANQIVFTRLAEEEEATAA